MTAEEEDRPLLSKISAVLAAQIMRYLPFGDTLQTLTLARGARPVLRHRSAWDPLIIGQRECSNLIRYLMKWRAHEAVPSGIFKVTELRADVGSVDFRGQSRMRYLHPMCTFQSLCEVLQCHFLQVTKLELTNIEDCNIDFDNPRRGCGFLMIRSGLLGEYSSVLLQVSEMRPKGTDSCTQALYRLTATRDGDFPSGLNPESLFLREHRACVELDGDYCVGHARQRKFARDSVERHYKAVIARRTLRESSLRTF